MKRLLSAIAAVLILGVLTSWAAYPVTLTWVAPTMNTNGTPLTDLAGFKIYCGAAPGVAYTSSVDIPDATATSYLDDGTLAPNGGEWYCVATAYDVDLNESSYSGEVRIDFLAPAAPANFQWN